MPGTLSSEKLDSIMTLITTGASFMDIMTALGKLGFAALSVLALGGTILATPFTIVLYIVSMKFFKNIERKRADRFSRQKEREQLSGYQKNTEAS